MMPEQTGWSKHMSISISLHVLAAMIWVGGMFYAYMAMRPAAAQVLQPEGSEHIDRSLSLVRESGCKSGLVFNPATPLGCLEHVMDKVDMILIMSVNPGFGGQSFIPSTLDKLRQARKLIDDSGFDIRLEVDGGVKVDNIREIAEAGADTFVAGSAIFGAASDSDANKYNTVVDAMRAELAKAA